MEDLAQNRGIMKMFVVEHLQDQEVDRQQHLGIMKTLVAGHQHPVLPEEVAGIEIVVQAAD